MTEHLQRLLNGLTDVRQAFVVTAPDLEVLAAEGPDESPSTQVAMLMRRCHQEKDRVLILDTAMDRTLGRAKVPFRSALCLLLPGGKRVLYLDSDKAGHFDVKAAEKIEFYVQKSRRWADEKAGPAAGSRPSFDLALRASAAILLMLVVLGALVSRLGSGPRPEGTARAAAENLLTQMRSKNFEEAYQAISPTMGLSRDAFAQALVIWDKDERNHTDLQYRTARSEADGVVLITGSSEAVEWRWTFVQEGSAWKLERADGGPLAKPGD